MDLLMMIREIQERVSQSPLFQEKGYDVLKEINANLELLAEKLDQPLRIAFIGEVKAGKSTLINAFAGGQVSPTNVTESTACILQIGYAETERAAILYSDGQERVGSPQEIYTILKQHEHDQQFFSHCDFVRMELPLQGLRHIHMIDTPGLATITQSNAQRTQSYFQAVDVVLWVLNGNYLGQSDINDILRSMAEMGKPIVGVINRVDEVDGDQDKLVDYVEESIGIYLDEIFPLSARKAFQGVMQHDASQQEESGFSALYSWLDENIDRKADTVQMESIKASAYALAEKLQLIHRQTLEEIQLKLETYMRLDDQIAHRSKMFQEEITGMVHYWIYEEFLENSKWNLVTRISELGLFSQKGSEEIQQALRDELTVERIKEELDLFLADLDRIVRKEWKECLSEVDEAIYNEFRAMIKMQEMDAATLSEQFPKMMGSTDALANSLMTAGTIGGTMAFYSAVLGPAAAHISIGAALSTFMPPVMIAGAAVGALAGYVKNKKAKAQYRSRLDSELLRIRRTVEQEIVPKITVYLQDMCEKTCQAAKKDFVEKNFNGHSEEELRRMILILQKQRKLSFSDGRLFCAFSAATKDKNDIRDDMVASDLFVGTFNGRSEQLVPSCQFFQEVFLPTQTVPFNRSEDLPPEVNRVVADWYEVDSLAALTAGDLSSQNVQSIYFDYKTATNYHEAADTYLLVYMPVNFYKSWLPLRFCLEKNLLPDQLSILELGPGPGTTTLAVMLLYQRVAQENPKRKFCLRYQAIERESNFAKMFTGLTEDMRQMVMAAAPNLVIRLDLVQEDILAGMIGCPTNGYDLLVESNVFNVNEGMDADKCTAFAQEAARCLKTDGVAVLVEPQIWTLPVWSAMEGTGQLQTLMKRSESAVEVSGMSLMNTAKRLRLRNKNAPSEHQFFYAVYGKR